MTARDLPVSSFWTERPLVRLFVEATGNETFSLKQLIAFAETLPDEGIIASLNQGDDNVAQVPLRRSRA